MARAKLASSRVVNGNGRTPLFIQLTLEELKAFDSLVEQSGMNSRTAYLRAVIAQGLVFETKTTITLKAKEQR